MSAPTAREGDDLMKSVPTDAGPQDTAVAERLENLEKRLRHLEAMIEGLQDAVHRESVRQAREIDRLQRKAEPAEIRRALGQDAREHGI
jgi:uncharacterized coiled-coil protein SlyX